MQEESIMLAGASLFVEGFAKYTEAVVMEDYLQ